MRNLNLIKEALQTVRLEEVAAGTGLSYFTLLRYRKGTVTRPPLETVQLISDWLDRKEELAGTLT